jgi:hypothetical protein
VRCPRCGNENPAANRFCGMCGATLLPAPAVSAAQQAAAQAPTAISPLAVQPAPAPQVPGPRVVDRRPAVPEREPVISGPSFLGLNQPASSQPASNAAVSSDRSAEPRRASLSIDPRTAPSSRSVDYLLEDDEPQSGGAGKFILIVVALLLAVGLGYMRWKNQGLGWLGKSASKPPAATDSADSSDPTSSASPAGTSSASPSTATAPTPTNPSPAASAPPASSQPPADHPGSADTGTATTAAAAPASATPPAATSPAATPPAGKTANSADASPGPSSSAAAPATDSVKDPNVDSADSAPAPAAKPKPSAAKPVAKSDPVTEAQKYIYGKGVKQDCDRGMRLLKPEADRSNPKAMTEMGALYSAGLCTPHDLPTAYRWFALALRKDPDNQALQGDLQKLWGEMTQPERQQAIRLSQ